MPWCWEDLANAIILQAIKDYRNARRRTRTKQYRREALARIREGCNENELRKSFKFPKVGPGWTGMD